MLIYTPPITYVAQVYSCDVYGGSAYNDCPSTTTSSGSSSSSSSNTSSSGSSSTGSSGSGTTTPSTGSTTPTTPTTSDNNGGNTSTSQSSNDNSNSTASTSQTSGNDMLFWALIILGAILVSAIIAWLIMLYKRRHRDDQLPPTQPPIMPNGPSNPFSAGQ